MYLDFFAGGCPVSGSFDARSDADSHGLAKIASLLIDLAVGLVSEVAG
jgi:hypothetical protein